MRMMRGIITVLLLVLVGGSCNPGDDTAGASDEVVQQMQAEINRLKAALDLATTGTTSVTVATETSVPDTAPSAVDLMPFYDDLLAGLAARTGDIGARAAQANTAWENEAATYDATHDVFTDVMIQATALATAAEVLPIPPELELRYADAIAAFGELADSTESLLGGLEAPDDGTLRRAAADRVARWVVTIEDRVAFDG